MELFYEHKDQVNGLQIAKNPFISCATLARMPFERILKGVPQVLGCISDLIPYYFEKCLFYHLPEFHAIPTDSEANMPGLEGVSLDAFWFRQSHVMDALLNSGIFFFDAC
jgi:hypothetical protein